MGVSRFLAFDIGAESGRAVAATLSGEKLQLQEIHRFLNAPVEAAGTLHWNLPAIFQEVLRGMRLYAERFGGAPDGLGIDTWGLDYGLLASDGSLLENPVHYRDRRTAGILDEVRRRIPAGELFERTGMSPSPIWSGCQLLSMRMQRSPLLSRASTFLMIPDLLAFLLTGRLQCERTNAVNTLLYNPRTRCWDERIVEAFEVPRRILPELTDPGTVIGELRDSVKAAAGWREGLVLAPCTHDTGSAVSAVPASGDDWAFLSSGTWSVVGAPCVEVVTSPAAFEHGLCNELTLDGFFLCRNIVGFWLLQQARLAWHRQGRDYTYEQIAQMAAEAPADGPLVDPEDETFLLPADMLAAMGAYCRRTNQPEPQGPGSVARTILESLALCYRRRLRHLADAAGREFRKIHVVGGGARNGLLCQFTAGATGLPVTAGPAEAAAMGNVLAQALARGSIRSAGEVRRIARASAIVSFYEPGDTPYWNRRYAQFLDYCCR